MPQEIKKVVIVGGGSAGWMTAAYLSRALDDSVNITLVESSNITTIGVGEATFSTIRLFFDYLGLRESDWMPSCNATYKMAIKFVNWNAEGRHFYHPFQRYDIVDGFNMAEWWMKTGYSQEAFDYACFVVPFLCDRQRSPRHLDGRVFDEKVQQHFSRESVSNDGTLAELKIQYPYAYHFDANLLAAFLKGYATKRGVHHVIGNVVDVKHTDDGRIDSIITAERGAVAGDLFIDCTGFRGLLINQAMNEPFISFSGSLLCDRAIAMQVPTDIQKNGIDPYTTATAMTSGWIWNIPLYGRIGTGYVYSSAFLDRNAAEEEFRAHLGESARNCTASHIKIRVGRCQRSWTKNCVAIGLSSGFVEPLESTGIFFIQHAIEELVSHFPDMSFDSDLIQDYNSQIANCVDGVRDFLTLHYYASNRMDTPFWRATKETTVLSEELKERVRHWRKRLPTHRNINPNYHGFEYYSYSVMLLGLGGRPESSLPILDHRNPGNAFAAFRAIRERARYLCEALPSQYEYLTYVAQQHDHRGRFAEAGVG